MVKCDELVAHKVSAVLRWFRSESGGALVRSGLLFVAVHMGPYQSLVPLERKFGLNTVRFLLDGLSRDVRKSVGGDCWDMDRVETTYGTLDRFLEREMIGAVVVGTSEGVPGGNVEELATRAAMVAGLSVFAVEDFPGNYRHRADCRLDGLFVEDDLSRNVPQARIYVTGNPRYDALKTMDREYLRVSTRAMLGLGLQRVVLWAGQPDGNNSYLALERIMPHLSKEGVVLLFKAHPRDMAYQRGRYERLLSGLALVRDVTSEKDTCGLCCAADLVVTQFSSVGGEAGHLGTPTLYVLFDDLGKAYMRRMKGYDVVPWAARNCSFLLDSFGDARAIIHSALFDEAARDWVRGNFRRCYESGPPAGEAVAVVIRAALEKSVA